MLSIYEPHPRENIILLTEFNLQEVGKIYTWGRRLVCRARVGFISKPLHVTSAEIREAIQLRRTEWKSKKNAAAKEIAALVTDASIEPSRKSSMIASLERQQKTRKAVHLEQIEMMKELKRTLSRAKKKARKHGKKIFPERPITDGISSISMRKLSADR